MAHFSLTITLLPKLYKYDIDRQYDETANELQLMLRQISNNFTLVCELTNNMNIHYHGIIELCSSKRKLVNIFRGHNKFGYISSRELFNQESWITYIKKDIKNTYEELGRRSILKDDYKIFTDNEMVQYGASF